MRSIAALLVCAVVSSASSGCAFVQLRTTAVVVVPDASAGVVFHDFEAVDTVPMTETAILCILSAIMYGGACWAYAAVPFDGQEAEQRTLAKADVAQALPCARVLDVAVEAVGWSVQRRWFAIKSGQHTFTNDELVELCRRTPKKKPEWKPPTTDPLPSTLTPQPSSPANPLPPAFDPAG